MYLLKTPQGLEKNLETVYRRLVNPRETHMLISSDQKLRVTQLQNPTSLVYRWQRSFSKNKCLNQSENHSVYGKTNVMTPLKAKCKLYLQQIMTTYRFDENNSLVQRTETKSKQVCSFQRFHFSSHVEYVGKSFLSSFITKKNEQLIRRLPIPFIECSV